MLRRADFGGHAGISTHRPSSLPFGRPPDRVSRGLRRTLVVPHCGDGDRCAQTGAASSGIANRAARAAWAPARSRSSTIRGTARGRRRRLGALAAEREQPSRADRLELVPGSAAPIRRPTNVVRAQMREIASIGVQTVIVSWWGPGSTEAARLPWSQRAARAAGLRVACTSSRSPDGRPQRSSRSCGPSRQRG